MKFRSLLFSLLILAMSTLVFADAPLVVERFSLGDGGKLPRGWKSRNDEMTEKASSVYKVVVEGENAYLMAHSKGEAIQIGKEIEIDLNKYPILRWTWKVDKLCEGGDERYKETGDSAAGVYVVFPSWKKWNPKAIKYVWSASDLPVGSKTKSPYASETKIIILQNKKSPLGKWIQEKVNVRADYESFWGKKLKNVKLIGIMTDSDNTKKEAIAAYDDLVFEGKCL
ncbi:MAG: DUF3047 domain-containing protein [Deltaproteobacteria bacterium]|nr:DUF3047 domain-containing protein [Deltaproteobacteria bacterium]